MAISRTLAGADDLSAQPGYVRSEFIYELAPFPSCHASTVVQAREGHLVGAWFGGTDEGNPDVEIWLSRKEKSGWTLPQMVGTGRQNDTTRYPCWNPVLFQPRKGPLLLFFKVGPSPSRWWGEMTTSSDGGKTWTPQTRLENHRIGPVRCKPLELADGALLCGSSTENKGWRIHFERTADLGGTWTTTGAIHDGKDYGAIQPTLLTHADGRVQALCRTRRSGVIVQTWSKDLGKTWSRLTTTGLPNPSAGVDAITLKDGRLLLVYNHTRRRGDHPRSREMINVAISRDGETWSAALVLENSPGEFSYPAVIQTADGLVHTTYTWKRRKVKHVVIDPAKLRLEPIADGKWPGLESW